MKGQSGTASRDDTKRTYRNTLYGKMVLRQLGRIPKRMGGRQHFINSMKHIEDGTNIIEYRHVLMDYSTNTQLKAKAMTRGEAFRRNENLRGTGFAWALCSK